MTNVQHLIHELDALSRRVCSKTLIRNRSPKRFTDLLRDEGTQREFCCSEDEPEELHIFRKLFRLNSIACDFIRALHGFIHRGIEAASPPAETHAVVALAKKSSGESDRLLKVLRGLRPMMQMRLLFPFPQLPPSAQIRRINPSSIATRPRHLLRLRWFTCRAMLSRFGIRGEIHQIPVWARSQKEIP